MKTPLIIGILHTAHAVFCALSIEYTTLDANLSIVSNGLNKIVRTLTVMSIILMFNALVAGIYGMNFEYMPELKWPYGYFGVLAFMAVATTLLILYFKRLKWF